MLFDVGADDEGCAAVGVYVVAAILGVVFDDEDQGVGGIGAVGYRLDDRAYGVVVVGDLEFRSVDAVDGCGEVAEVVVHEAHEGEVGEVAAGYIAIELTLPLGVAEVVREAVVKAAEVGIGVLAKNGVAGVGDLEFIGEGGGIFGDA